MSANEIFFVICTRFQKSPSGEMLEWLKRHAWKACIRQKCIAGSNPALSAKAVEPRTNLRLKYKIRKIKIINKQTIKNH